MALVIFSIGLKSSALFVLGPARAKPKTTFEEYMRIEKEFSEPGTCCNLHLLGCSSIKFLIILFFSFQVFLTKTIRSTGNVTVRFETWAAPAGHCCVPTCSASTITPTGQCTRRARGRARRLPTWSEWVSSTKSTAKRAPSSSHSANARGRSTTELRRLASATNDIWTSSPTTSALASSIKLLSHSSMILHTLALEHVVLVH